MVDGELRHLATMTAALEEDTGGRAAIQSTISRPIAALEKFVGGPAFERPGGPRPVRITPLGAMVFGRELPAKADAVELFKATLGHRKFAGQRRVRWNFALAAGAR